MFGNNYDRDNSYVGGKSASINVGEEHKVKIEDFRRDWDEIARIEGFIIFVTSAKVSEKSKLTPQKKFCLCGDSRIT